MKQIVVDGISIVGTIDVFVVVDVDDTEQFRLDDAVAEYLKIYDDATEYDLIPRFVDADKSEVVLTVPVFARG